ncbi:MULTISPECIES: ATP-dependent zinc protease [unclassified Colwellia]|uniref:ATP-dependent zinc protease family protein n=1 Tax=unclassified Colwellia TaxID=196834 RepID=UPI0015F5FF6B|nr:MULTISPECIES: ATP-dependent zinc protease [unclassified Colwellia]MBA6224914.1 ATP-dependent zinc protease [Colwellia sp. MB3u-45]MBA6268798.1 ATP-dependent zinc protease [Colwellia sp. MB3u-43]MBA6287456.1 ATP-dependent zinc protease [Colwellia sp. MB3u-4]MBA6296285.1 ATP-dependent zinc protease [Colwellia sp. MB02u-9]MBA6321229.1 ATP-dependent zinc protease [Colwellia sp. MB02u-19]
MTTKQKIIIGSLETITLPDLAITDIQVRVDTGAKTSSLHVDNITKFKKNGKVMVRFDLHPDVYNVENMISCEAPIHDIRRVKSSNGTSEQRYVISTPVKLGSELWPIEITLTDRSDMSYLMLFGREAIGERFLIDPSKAFVNS